LYGAHIGGASGHKLKNHVALRNSAIRIHIQNVVATATGDKLYALGLHSRAEGSQTRKGNELMQGEK
jgi:hypothetical protein